MPPTPLPPSSNTKKRISLWAVAVFVGVLLLLVLIALRLIQGDAAPLMLGEQPKDFTLTTFDGEVIHTADLRGRAVLINFWASWCTTCEAEASLLEQTWQAMQADGNEAVLFLGVAYMDTERASQAYLAGHGVTFPNGADLGGAISRTYQVKSVPETFILDANGVLRVVKIGPFSSVGELQAAIDQVLTHPGD
jgi:peroxiredoxin